jgi:hypothetical protein
MLPVERGIVVDHDVVSQQVLDELASAWSRLDRARPREPAGVAPAMHVVYHWVTCALAVDGLLFTILSGVYAATRAEESCGPALLALRWVWEVVEGEASMDALLSPASGPEHSFWELYWRPLADLRLDLLPAEGRDHYGRHLAGRPVRTPASAITSFLLTTAALLERAR